MDRVYIWGAAKYGKEALEYCQEHFNICGFVDKRWETITQFCGLSVVSDSALFSMPEQQEVSLIVAIRYPAEVLKVCEQNHFKGKIYIFDGRNEIDSLLYEVKNGEICVPEYIDKRYVEWKEYAEHYSKLNSYVRKMFETAQEWVQDYDKGIDIVELGAGSGQFANMLFDNGYENYCGVDFSSEAIELARQANPKFADAFRCEDAFIYLEQNRGRKVHLFCIFEVLEHIKRDIDLIDMLPKESDILFSVPNFMSFNHMRTFQSLDEIKERYPMLEIMKYIQLPASDLNEKIYHLVLAKKAEKL